MAEVPLAHGLMLAMALFALGLLTVLSRRNIVFILLGIEIMLNAAGLVFVLGGARWGQADGQVMFILVLAVAADVVSVGLAMVLQLINRFESDDDDEERRMRG
jgi:NADH-quinone oxidoreductase subunit K